MGLGGRRGRGEWEDLEGRGRRVRKRTSEEMRRMMTRMMGMSTEVDVKLSLRPPPAQLETSQVAVGREAGLRARRWVCRGGARERGAPRGRSGLWRGGDRGEQAGGGAVGGNLGVGEGG